VYDRVNKWGGAERVLLALHTLWPDAPLFTAVYDRANARWADVFSVHPSFLQRIPLVKGTHESLPILTPIAFESFNFDAYDVVISVTSAEAKDIITKPETIHICYCLTPTRYLWSSYDQYQKKPGLGLMSGIAGAGLRAMAPLLRSWDLTASSRPDYYVAISKRVRKRIETYYKRDVTAVIYPPVDTDRFALRKNIDTTQAYFLTVSRLVSYKRLDVTIRAFNELGLPLVIIGTGRQRNELKKMAKSNIQFVDRHLTDSDLVRYYEGCRAFVFAADEDFGLAAAEAQAMGIPVISYRHSGVSEIVKDDISGILFDEQTPDSLIRAVHRFIDTQWNADQCRKQAMAVSEKAFQKEFKVIVETLARKKHI